MLVLCRLRWIHDVPRQGEQPRTYLEVRPVCFCQIDVKLKRSLLHREIYNPSNIEKLGRLPYSEHAPAPHSIQHAAVFLPFRAAHEQDLAGSRLLLLAYPINLDATTVHGCAARDFRERSTKWKAAKNADSKRSMVRRQGICRPLHKAGKLRQEISLRPVFGVRLGLCVKW